MAHFEWFNPAGHIIAVRFDAVRTVDHRQNATVAKHPVQKGAKIADHVHVDLPAVSVTGYVSIAPLFTTRKIGGLKEGWEPSGSYQRIELPASPGGYGNIEASASAMQGGVVQAGLGALGLLSGITSPNSVESIVTDDPESRVSLMYELLTDAQQNKLRVNFIDEVRDYKDMIITHVAATRTQREYGAAFQVELEQVKLVSTKMLREPPLPAEPRAEPAVAAGAAAPKLMNDPGDEERARANARSIAVELLSQGAGALGVKLF